MAGVAALSVALFAWAAAVMRATTPAPARPLPRVDQTAERRRRTDADTERQDAHDQVADAVTNDDPNDAVDELLALRRRRGAR